MNDERPAYAEIVGFDIPNGRYRIAQVVGETSFVLIDDNEDFHSVELGSPGTSMPLRCLNCGRFTKDTAKLPGRLAWLCKARTAQGCA